MTYIGTNTQVIGSTACLLGGRLSEAFYPLSVLSSRLAGCCCDIKAGWAKGQPSGRSCKLCLLACLPTPSLPPTFSCHHNSGNNEMKELFELKQNNAGPSRFNAREFAVTTAFSSGHVQFCQNFVVKSAKAVWYVRRKMVMWR